MGACAARIRTVIHMATGGATSPLASPPLPYKVAHVHPWAWFSWLGSQCPALMEACIRSHGCSIYHALIHVYLCALQHYIIRVVIYTRYVHVCMYYVPCLNQFHLQIPRLFDGCEFYFCGNFLPPNPSKGDLVRLVKMAGGAVLSREPRSSPVYNHTVCPYHAKPGFTSHFIVISGSSTYPIKADSGAFHVSPTWIFDCLSHFELMNTPID